MNRTIEFKSIQAADWPAIEHIQRECYSTSMQESRCVLQSKWRASPSSCFVAYFNESVIGYCLAHPWQSGSPPPLHLELTKLVVNCDTLYIHDVAIIPNMQGRGIAQAILTHLISLAKTNQLHTLALTSLPEALNYWRKSRFSVIKTTKDISQYGNGSRYMQRTVQTN